jgi:ATP-binding cassette subfamily B protein
MIYAVMIVAIAISILFSRNVKLTIISICLLPFIMLASFIFFRKAKKIFLECDLAESSMTSVLQENLNAMRVVKAFHQEEKEIEKFETFNEAYRKKYFDLMHALGIFWSGTDFLGLCQYLIMMISGVYMALEGELTTGTFFIFLMYESMIIWPIRQLGRILADMGKVSVSIKRIKEVLEEPCEELEKGLCPEIKGDIVFDHVNFRYADDPRMVLKDISFHIPAGTKVAIMGPTGSGKSSLVHLLTGIYDYPSGRRRTT